MAASGARMREIKLGQKLAEEYPTNAIKTSKYTPYNFVPLNLFEQLNKFGNVYFLLISVLMYLGEKTDLFIGTIKAFSTLATLIMMMGVTALVAFLDDEQRKKADRETNAQTIRRFTSNGDIQDCEWQELVVGDVLAISQDEELPADVVVVCCASSKGNCYVSTANLDGETNLKLKEPPEKIQKALYKGNAANDMKDSYKQLAGMNASLQAEAPKTSIYDFEGRLQYNGGDESLEFKQILLRGTVLRNTPWCIGIVVYTGSQTRMVMNSRPAPMKQSNLERVTNNVMLVILSAQASLALVSDIIYLFVQDDFKKYWYLYPPDLILPDWLAYWLTFFVLYSNLMPISLYPTMEACNSAHSYFIKNDMNMYYEELEFPAGVRSTNLCQEIGQVTYVFSDKTGTLTQNVMELKKVSIAGEVYGTLVEGAKGFNGAQALADARNSGNTAVDEFLEVLGVSHTAMATTKSDGKLTYEVESPDEGALVDSAAECGWAFQGREGSQAIIKTPNGERRYTVLATNEFNSTRKRMSVVVKLDGEVWVLAKGADNVMLERATQKDEVLQRHLTAFSVEGLRTLVFARRKLSGNELTEWQAKYDAAMRQVGADREGALEAAAALVEKDLVIVGASAIEDKLQDGVPEAIVKIRAGGMKLWVLTGDKLETAQNIGYSSRVLNNAMEIVIVDVQIADTQDQKYSNFAQVVDSAKRRTQDASRCGKDAGVMITGAALEQILPDVELRKSLIAIGNACSVLIACRVSPLQKAEMVKLIRGEMPTAITLAIGDGANDVPMIQEAHVGVGIAGREGRQAVNNSDFAIGQFKYLERLLFVHGRWNYRRVCKFTLFTFWRNAVQVLMIFYYTFMSGFSGTSLFEDWIRLSFNFLCSFPIMATGCFDQDVPEQVALRYPRLYAVGRIGKDLNATKILQALLSAITHSLIILCLTALAFPSLDIHGAGDYYTFGTAVYSCLLVDMNYRAGFLTFTHNKYTVGSIAASFFLYAFYLCVYPCSELITRVLAPNMYMVPYHMVQHVIFWLCIISVPAIASVVDMFIMFCFQTFDDTAHEIFALVSEHEKIEPDAKYNLLHAVDFGTCCADPSSSRDSGSGESVPSDSMKRHIDVSDVAQQKTPSTRFILEPKRLKIIFIIIGVVNLCLGSWSLYLSAASKQIRIHYEGPKGYDPWGTKEHEVVRAQKDCESKPNKRTKCRIKHKVLEDLEPPILLYYAIGPFFQNYNDYLKSEVPKELHGEIVPESLRETFCVKPTRIDDKGNDIVPCGMKSTSMFNDTFGIQGYEVDKKNLGWEEDRQRYQNPSDYLKRPHTSWLYERYDDVVSKEEGVDNDQFLVWMRPSALSRVWNPYGYIRDKAIRKGDTITIDVESNFPMAQMGGWKQLVLTTTGTMGGRHHGFGYCLLGSGVGCFLLYIVVGLIQSCTSTG